MGEGKNDGTDGAPHGQRQYQRARGGGVAGIRSKEKRQEAESNGWFRSPLIYSYKLGTGPWINSPLMWKSIASGSRMYGTLSRDVFRICMREARHDSILTPTLTFGGVTKANECLMSTSTGLVQVT